MVMGNEREEGQGLHLAALRASGAMYRSIDPKSLEAESYCPSLDMAFRIRSFLENNDYLEEAIVMTHRQPP